MGLNKPAQFMESVQGCLKKAGKVLNPKQSFENGLSKEMLSVARQYNDLSKFKNEVLVNSAKDMVSNKGISKEAEKAFKEAGYSIPKNLEQLGATAKQVNATMDSMLTNYGNLIGDGASGAKDLTQRGQIVVNGVKDYYNPSQNGIGTTLARAGATLGLYEAGALGVRYASGGTLTTNSNGESDIAGIPFI